MKKLSDYKEQINKCSKCGKCQEVCPIYKLTGNDCAVSRGKFVMLNGTSVWFATPITADNQYQTIAWFYVDVNGKAMPNVIGRDLYMFEYRNGGFYPGGAPDSLYKKCGLPKSGWGCAYVVLQNQNIDHIRKK